MTKRQEPFGKAGKITYWISTIWLALGMLKDTFAEVFPALFLLLLTMVSLYFRPRAKIFVQFGQVAAV